MEPRVVPVFEHQTLVTLFGVQARIRSDPIPLEGADRISCGLTVEYAWVTPPPAPPPNQLSLMYLSEVSDDGVYWVGQGVSNLVMGPVADAVLQDTGNVQAALVRFVAILDIPVGAVGDIAAVSFDLHVAIDHA